MDLLLGAAVLVEWLGLSAATTVVVRSVARRRASIRQGQPPSSG